MCFACGATFTTRASHRSPPRGASDPTLPDLPSLTWAHLGPLRHCNWHACQPDLGRHPKYRLHHRNACPDATRAARRPAMPSLGRAGAAGRRRLQRMTARCISVVPLVAPLRIAERDSCSETFSTRRAAKRGKVEHTVCRSECVHIILLAFRRVSPSSRLARAPRPAVSSPRHVRTPPAATWYAWAHDACFVVSRGLRGLRGVRRHRRPPGRSKWSAEHRG